jgi:hypothetical protein
MSLPGDQAVERAPETAPGTARTRDCPIVSIPSWADPGAREDETRFGPNRENNLPLRQQTEVVEARGRGGSPTSSWKPPAPVSYPPPVRRDRRRPGHLLLPATVRRNWWGYLRTGPVHSHSRNRPPLLFETSTPGVFAVGDVRSGVVKRRASSVAWASSRSGSCRAAPPALTPTLRRKVLAVP